MAHVWELITTGWDFMYYRQGQLSYTRLKCIMNNSQVKKLAV